MQQLQKESQRDARYLSFEELQDNLKSILINHALIGQPFVVDVPGYYPIRLHSVHQYPSPIIRKNIRKNQVVSPIKKLKTFEKPDRSTMSEEEYEEKHRAWRKYIIESVAGSIKDTKTLDKELKERRAVELRAARKMGKW